MPETFLYLTTRGRKTGLPRRIEIWFVEHRGCHFVVAEGGERAGWVKAAAVRALMDAKYAWSDGLIVELATEK